MRPITIGVGGAHSGAGKTACASLLLRNLKGWGAIKYTKTGLYSSIVDDLNILNEENKDTRRLLDSGAERVLWVKSPPSELKEVLPMAVERLSDLRGIIVEGNSAIEFLGVDIIIFVFGNDSTKIKESAKGLLQKADVVVSNGRVSVKAPRRARRFRRSVDESGSFLRYVEGMIKKKERIRSLLTERSVDGKISCSVARKVAKDLSVPFSEVGKAANELGIKIMDCELGCF